MTTMNQSSGGREHRTVGFVLHENRARIDPTVIDRDLSPAPLWRNAPGHGTKMGATPKPNMANTPVAAAFQQSLRSYPVKSPSMPSFSTKRNERNFVTNLEDETRKSEQTSPFYLDYLGSMPTSSQPGNQSGQPFDHGRFMDMFRVNRNNNNQNGNNDDRQQRRRQQQVVAKSGISGNNRETKTLMEMTASGDDNSLPYSVNDDSYGCLESAGGADAGDTTPLGDSINNNKKNSAIISGGEDSIELTGGDSRTSAPTSKTTGGGVGAISGVRMRIHRPGPATRASRYSAIECRQPISSARDSEFERITANNNNNEKRQQQRRQPNLSSSVSYHRPLHQYQQPKATAMENKSNTSNVTQRIQSAAERRAQIDDARRERFQRNVEQTSMKTLIHGGPIAPSAPATIREQPQAFQSGHSTNPSVAFGSTRPRNIDLTRPLVTPLPVRPKSEIFTTGGLPYNMSQSQIDSATPSHRICSRDDNIAPQPPPSRPTDLGPMPFEPVIQATVSKNTVQSPMSFFRAARRHDPELIPAKQRYQFRDYAAPSSGWSFGSGIKKENSVMTCSMTSSKSYQTRHALIPESGLNRASKKKSYSMNRLDQLAQPRKRAEPRGTGKSPDVQTANNDRPATSKPTPPPKNFSTSSIRSSKETVGRRSPPTSASSLGANRKPRPLSQIETTSESRAASNFEPPKTSDEPALSDKSEREEERLAEYKRQLAEKRAKYRKMQEQKTSQPSKQSSPFSDKPEQQKSDSNESSAKDSPRVVPRRPRAAMATNENKSLAEETKEALEKQPTVSPAKEEQVASPSTEVRVESPESSSSSASPASCDSNASQDGNDATLVQEYSSQDRSSVLNRRESLYETPSADKTWAPTEQLDEAVNAMSICDDSIIQQTTMDKSLLKANPMNASFDSSLLHSSSPAAAQQQPTINPNVLTTEEIEKRKQEQLRKHEIERQARKSRIQEILKGRTRKDDIGSNGSDGDNGKDNTGGGNISSTDESSIESQQPQSIVILSNGGGTGNEVDSSSSFSSSSSTTVHMNGNSQTASAAVAANGPYVKTNGVHHETLLTTSAGGDTAEANGF